METKTLVLKLVLDSLGVSSDITSVDDRLRVQKAVYLGQLSGVDLGYRYSWYLKGPYSTALTRDYYALEDELESGSTEHEERELKQSVLQKLERVRPLMTPPWDVSLKQEQWLELLASFHFLTKVSGRPKEEAVKILQRQKPHVADYVEIAAEKLKRLQIWGAHGVRYEAYCRSCSQKHRPQQCRA
jgi:uncharacterized protein YwgA